MSSPFETLESYLATEIKSRPVQNESGEESEWLNWAEFEKSAGRIRIVDASLFAAEGEGIDIDLAPGQYRASVKMVAFGRDRRVAAFRVARTGAAVNRGIKIGELGIDSGRMVLLGAELGDRLVAGERPLEFKRLIDESHGMPWVWGQVEATPFAVLATGFGDGEYPVYALDSPGFELEFLGPGATYPFEVPNVSAEQEEAEGVHWKKIEHLWDPMWEALRRSLADARAYFDKLTPGERALLAIDLFNKVLLQMRPEAFIANASARVVADEVARGYELLGAMDYAENARPFLASIPEIEPTASARERMMAARAARAEHQAEIWRFMDWFEQEMYGSANPIEKRILAYIHGHPEEFVK